MASLVAEMVKTLPAMHEAWVPSLGREDSLEKGMATHSSIFFFLIFFSTPVLLPGEFHGQRSQVGHSPWSLKESDTTEQLSLHFTKKLT